MTTDQNFNTQLEDLRNILETKGLVAALNMLNKRTPHRFTGIYQYQDSVLKNIAIFDQYDDTVTKSEEVPLSVTYCSLLKEIEALEVINSIEDERVNTKIITPVISYCGALIRDVNGQPFGSLCHFDMKRSEQNSGDFELLQGATHLFYQHLNNHNLVY